PCYSYNELDDPRRATNNLYSSHAICDCEVNWDGWYRLFFDGLSVQMPDTCVDQESCGTHAPLWLKGGHPKVEDGVVTRDVCGHWMNDCCSFLSNPIRVKACPGGYYIYELVKPSFCFLAYCTEVRNINTSYAIVTSATKLEPTPIAPVAPLVDPCYNYSVLDDEWRSTNNRNASEKKCDCEVNWSGWYRLFIKGQSVQMPDTCVAENSCATSAPLWLSGGHPRVEDGVVIRDVCGHWSNNCCYFQSNPIRVKSCPGNYFVYEFVKPEFCSLAYCADPCYSYNELDDPRRATNNLYSSHAICDCEVNWDGWYRLFFDGLSVQMPDTCVDQESCGTHAPLWLKGGHPKVEDGVVTRDVCGHWMNDCCSFLSNPIRVKACPGGYYIYELVKPSFCFLAYCTEVRNINTSYAIVTSATKLEPTPIAQVAPPIDPCQNHSVLDDEWRSSNNRNSSEKKCDCEVNWSGWYRLFIKGQSVQMPDTCVDQESCGTHAPLWLRGGHPRVEDGVVTRDVCGHWSNNCCYFQSNPIRVKACSGNYFVYEFVKPEFCSIAYCAVKQTSIIVSITDPCYSYNELDDPRRATNNLYSSHAICDCEVNWDGWYRLFFDGLSVQMPDTCVDQESCGTHAPLWLKGGHPKVEDGVVTRDVCGHWMNDCCSFLSNPIRVKACPGGYYIYELVKPSFCFLAYCTEVRNINTSYAIVTSATKLEPTPIAQVAPLVDPCYNYSVLDDEWRSTNNRNASEKKCDCEVNWSGWYRLFIKGQSVQMPDTCVAENSCATSAPLWLRGGHPRVEDGVVTRDVCGHWSNNCCYFQSNPIRVKACPGNYFVYEFVKPEFCSLAYCA
ncbi:hypothetical protein DNTS_007875, partial [Danionella cerebrum]